MSRLWKVVQEAWAARQGREQVRMGRWLVNLRTGQATCGDKIVLLPPLEYALLACMSRHRGQVVDAETLRRET